MGGATHTATTIVLLAPPDSHRPPATAACDAMHHLLTVALPLTLSAEAFGHSCRRCRRRRRRRRLALLDHTQEVLVPAWVVGEFGVEGTAEEMALPDANL